MKDRSSMINSAWFEPALLFFLFYFPGYLLQGAGPESGYFDNLLFHLTYWFQAGPQIALILYLIGKSSSKNFTDFSLRRLQWPDIRAALPILGGLAALQLVIGLSRSMTVDSLEPVRLFSNYPLIPVVVVTCLLTGYSEELFFRSYLLGIFKPQESAGYSEIIFINLLFASGHYYQGYTAFLGSFLMGLFLTWAFLKTKRFHSVAIAHSLFNFFVLLLS